VLQIIWKKVYVAIIRNWDIFLSINKNHWRTNQKANC